jgi:hypothetical protein
MHSQCVDLFVARVWRLHYSNLEEIAMYVPFENSHGYGTSCFDRTIAPRGCNNAGLVGCKLQELFQ